MNNNKLKLNEDKTEFLVIGSKYHLKKVNVEHIILGEDCIPKTEQARNLGVG